MIQNKKIAPSDICGEAFCPLPPWARRLMTFGPLLGFGLTLAAAGALAGSTAVYFILSMSLGGFIGGGKLVILAGAIDSAPLGVYALAGLVVYGDLATALIIMANMHLLYRIPAMGLRLAAAREAGYRVLNRHAWMRRATTTGLIVFIAVPFQGTGAVLGVVLGRILGLSRLAIFIATLSGSLTGSLLVALVGTAGQQKITMLAENPALGLVTVIISLAATFLLGKWFLGQSREDQS